MSLRLKLPDLLAPDLRVVFCGTAAGTQSAQKQVYYAGPGNRFWRVLHEIGLTTRQLAPDEYQKLLAYRIGLTDVCKTSAGMDEDIPIGAFAPAELATKIGEFEPSAIAFNGKKAARLALGLKTHAAVEYGPRKESFGGAVAWVLPSTSRAASGFWDAATWRALAARLPD